MLAPGLQAKLTGSNLLNDDFRLTYTKKDTEQNLHRQWRTGAQLSVSLSYTY